MGKLQANDKRGHKADLRAASSTDSSLARMPPILLKAGIWIPYFSSSFLILLISSSERTTEKKKSKEGARGEGGKETLFLKKIEPFSNNLLESFTPQYRGGDPGRHKQDRSVWWPLGSPGRWVSACGKCS